MNIKKKNKKILKNTVLLLSIITLSVFCQISFMQNLITTSNYNEININERDLRTSETDYYSEDWISNGDFSSGSSNWYSDISGDSTDANAYISSGAANYAIDGNSGSFSLVEDGPNNSSGDWHHKTDPYFPSAADPYQDGINSEGFWFRHYFQEGSGLYTQLASRVWSRDFTLDRNISDYLITSASLTATFNATVYRDIDIPGDSYADSAGNPITYASSYDFGRFFLLLSDVNRNIIYEAGYYHLDSLGSGYSGTVSMSDTGLITVTGDTLIYYLTSILSQDYQTFSIALGVRVYCEDNRSPSDSDRWQYLLFNYLSLSFTYEKKIDQETKISWNQDGSTIPSNYEIENATLNFQYRIDNDWVTSTGSVNSEFRIVINNNQLGETVKLSTATGTYKYFKPGGLDVSSFIVADEEVNLSIQVYIGDEFTLDSDVIITIDNVNLTIGYGIFTPPDATTYDLLLNDVDRTTEKSTQVIYGNNLNVTFVYKNSTGDFIAGADVEISGAGLPPTSLSQDLINEQYYTIIDTTDLGVGTSYLTLTASKSYHTSQEFQITVTIISRDTELQLFLNDVNETLDKEITIPWNENLNITIKYMDLDNIPKTHINGANVELTGAGATKVLIEDGGNEQYEYSINAYILGVGSTFLTVYASKDNYTSLNIRFKVTVTTRTTYLDNIELDSIERDSIEIEWNEFFDVSVIYRDFDTDNPITGAFVQLLGTNYNEILNPSGNTYILTVDTFDLSIGNNFLTLLAQKDNYTIASELITVIVDERATTIDTILNHTSTTAISYPFGELLNITAVYSDHTGPFIDGAVVELREGASLLHTLTKSAGIDQYSYVFNTNELSIGVNLLTVYAKKDNYTAAFGSITVTINERDTSLEIYLDGALTTGIDKEFDESLNITVFYKDFTDAFIDGADCELRRGETLLFTLPKDPFYPQYERVINTKDLGLGTNLLAIYANQDNYTALLVSITVIVSEKGTSMDIILDDTPGTTIEVIYDEFVNITAIYKDSTSAFIDGATVELRKGVNVLEPLSESASQYSVLINSNRLTLGGNILSVYAYKTNYSVALVTILIIVNERDTTLDVLLDGINSDTFEFYNVSINDSVNIVAIYDDFEDNFVAGATVELTGSGISELLTPGVGQYTYTLDALTLGIGVHFLVITASLENFSVSIKDIKLNILERNSTLQLLVDDIDLTTSRYVATEIDQILNITVFFTDPGDSSYIPGANIRLTGALEANFTENFALQQYNVSLDTNDLQQGINFLTIFAQKDNYQSRSLIFTIEVKQKNSTIQLLVDDIDLTTSRYVATEIDQILNITVFFTDPSDSSYIPGANIRLTGALEVNFTENFALQQYNVSLNTNDLQQGINFLTIFAQKANYQSRSLIFTIEVKQKNSSLQLILNDVPDPIDNSIKVTIGEFVNLTVIYKDDEMNFIDNASIIIVGEGLNQTDFTEHLVYDQYNVSINTLDLKFGINLLTLYAQKANYQPQTLIVRIEINEKETDMDIYLNGIPQTPQDRSITLPIKALLNITVKYYDNETGIHIPGSVIQLVGEDLTDYYLTEYASLEQYVISINTTLLDIGVRFLTIYATHANYQSYSALLRIQVDRIKTNITTLSGAIVFNRQPGDDFRLQLKIQDLNFSVNILKANVSYTWVYGQGTLSDANNDGIYETTITNLPGGTFQIAITVYAGDDYDFERFFITLNVIRPPEDVLLFQILTFAGIAAAVGISAYLIAYQRVLKYPKQVRKIRKFKSKLKKSKSLKIETLSRDEIINRNYTEKIHPLEKQFKSKISSKSTKIDESSENLKS